MPWFFIKILWENNYSCYTARVEQNRFFSTNFVRLLFPEFLLKFSKSFSKEPVHFAICYKHQKYFKQLLLNYMEFLRHHQSWLSLITNCHLSIFYSWKKDSTLAKKMVSYCWLYIYTISRHIAYFQFLSAVLLSFSANTSAEHSLPASLCSELQTFEQICLF